MSAAADAYRPFGAFRFLLAGMVVVSHLHLLAGYGSVLSPLGLGNMGVMTFFILSGYVIAEAIALFYAGRPGAFLINRLLRIFPPFLVALLLSIVIHALLMRYHELRFFDPVSAPQRMFDARNLIGNALSLALPVGLGRLGFAVDYPFVRYSWAVAIELLFYYAMAGLVLLSLRAWIRDRFRPAVYWGAVACAAMLAFIVSMLTHLGSYQLGWIPYFLLGVSLYHYAVANDAVDRTVTFVITALSFVAVNWHAYEYVSRNPTSQTLAALVILDALIVAMWLLSRLRAGDRLMRVDQFLGDLTYPLYLNHYAVGIALLSLVPAEHFSVGVFVAGLVVATLFSYLAMQMSEPFTQRLRERIRGRRL